MDFGGIHRYAEQNDCPDRQRRLSGSDSMKSLRSFLGISPGNPMNVVVLILLAFFGLVLVGAPILMAIVGLGTGGIILFEIIAALATLLIMGLIIAMARGFGHDLQRLLDGNAWAHWHLTSAERDAFLQDDRERTRETSKRYALYSLALIPLGALFAWLFTRDAKGAMLGALAFGGAGLLVVVTTLLWDGTRPRQDASDLDEVYLGDLGIYAFGRFTPLSGVGLSLKAIKLTKSDPSYLTFTTVSRGEYGEQQPRDISVPIPAGHEEEAETLVERFKQRFSLT